MLAASAPVQAQTDWFRPPADIGSGGRASQPTRSQQIQRAPSRQQQTRQQQTRQQQVRTQRQQPRREPEPRRAWTPFQPLLDLFGGGERRRPENYRSPPEQRAPVVRTPVIAAPVEVRGTVYDNIGAARAAADEALDNVVLVLGDENAAALAQGLADTFVKDRKGVAVVGRSEPGSGLAPGGRFDWVRSGVDLALSEEAGVVVLFAGANDLTSITEAGLRGELFDEQWRDLYGRRVDEFLLGIKLRGRQAVIVGLPPVEDAAAGERHAQFNSFMKERVERAGFVFVDVWDGFVDENGKFIVSGPDVDGQRRRLRTADGIGFTRAGGRKLAFFVDKQLDDLLSREVPEIGGPTAAERPSIVVLSGGASAGARTLAGGPAAALAVEAALQPALAVEGEAPDALQVLVNGKALPPVIGRVDDFRWPPHQPTEAEPAAAVAPVPPAMPAVAPSSVPVGTPASGAPFIMAPSALPAPATP